MGGLIAVYLLVFMEIILAPTYFATGIASVLIAKVDLVLDGHVPGLVVIAVREFSATKVAHELLPLLVRIWWYRLCYMQVCLLPNLQVG